MAGGRRADELAVDAVDAEVQSHQRAGRDLRRRLAARGVGGVSSLRRGGDATTTATTIPMTIGSTIALM